MVAISVGPAGDLVDQATHYMDTLAELGSTKDTYTPTELVEVARLQLMQKFPDRFPTEDSVKKMLCKGAKRLDNYIARHGSEPSAEAIREKLPYFVKYYEILASLGWKRPGTN